MWRRSHPRQSDETGNEHQGLYRRSRLAGHVDVDAARRLSYQQAVPDDEVRRNALGFVRPDSHRRFHGELNARAPPAYGSHAVRRVSQSENRRWRIAKTAMSPPTRPVDSMPQ